MYYKISNGAVSLGGETVLAYIDFEIFDGEKIAIVGRNGAGKTTLLKCITGEIAPEAGSGEETFNISKSGDPVIGHLAQITFEDETVSMLDEILTVFKPLLDMENRLETLRKRIEKEPDEKSIQEYATLNERFELMGGYTYKKEYSIMIKKFGFSVEDMDKPLKDFSGGQRTKIAFCKLLLSHPDILLLDDRAIQRVLRDVENSDLGVALKGANEEVQNAIFKNLSSRLAAMIKEDMEYMGPVRMKDVEEAQQKIVGVIRKLEDSSEIVISRGGGDDLVV